ncbi:MAG: acyl-CoA dehydrogenase [Alphaproteobacteria bacterium]|nr:acyl-CoA dehydrogenase [Alphaproteobacteria bacterium]
MRFLLNAFDYDGVIHSLPFAEDFDSETVMSMLEEYCRFCEEVLMPLNAKGDKEGVTFNPEDASVSLPDGFKEAFQAYAELGFIGLTQPAEYDGLAAPHAMGTLASEVLIAANKSLSMCPGLTYALLDAMHAHASDELKERYLPKLISGEYTGTMALTEPQCGTDLGMLTTKAEPYGDHYKLTGTKLWITFGEHDLAENIIHLVLARLPDAPAGIKGISVFVVPKFLEDGTRNPVFCGGTDHKMGIHASPTCVMNFEDAEGWLVGVPHKGMRAMFTMMNHARLNVGIEGLALGHAAYLEALAFSKDRRQSRSLDPAKQELNEAADNILVHPDVRRMLLNIKSTTEGLRGLALYIGMQLDLAHHAEDEATRKKADDIVQLLTPIIKSYGSEQGFLNTSEAMQITGGAGYTTDWPIEQYLRDLRIAMIYEGTNHIQALDLVGRKLPKDSGRLIQAFQGEVTALIREAKGNEALAEFVGPLKRESKRLTEVTMAMAGRAFSDREEAGAAASNYLNLFALTTLAYIWCRQAKYALENPEDAMSSAKLATARYFMAMVLPQTETYAAQVNAGKAPMMDYDVDWF